MHRIVWPGLFSFLFYPPSELESRETLVYFNFDDNYVWRQAGLRNQVYRSYPAGFISHVGYGYTDTGNCGASLST